MKMFEWDENKRLKNLESKNLDFIDAVVVFDGRAVISAPSRYAVEDRFVSTAVLDDGKFYSVIWTWRDDDRWIISYRRAHNDEARNYRAHVG